MNPHKQAEKDLKAAGYTIKRDDAKHTIWYNAELKSTIPLKRHDFNDNDLKYIRKEIRQNEQRKG
jgi:hypothetical protein